LNTEDKQLQLFNYVTKSCEEFSSNENLTGLNKILAELNPAQFPIPAFAAYTTKLQIQGKYNIEELKNTIAKLKSMTSALSKQSLPPKFATVFFFALKSLADACLAKKVPLLGIKPLHEAIIWYTDGQPELLTPAHASFLCLCLKARHFYLCDPFINIDAEMLLTQGLQCRTANKASSLAACGSEPICLFFYYSALIRIAQCRYKEGLLFLEQLICMRGMCNSAIVVEGFKLAVIVALILGQDQLFLPGCRNVKYLQGTSRAYMALAFIVTSAKMTDNIPALVKDFTEKNRKVFQQDNTYGLIDVLVRKLQERKICAVPKTFINIDRKRAMTRTYYNDNEIFDSVVRKLINTNELKCTVDGGSDIYCFRKVTEDEKVSDEDESKLTEQLENLAQLTTTVRNIHDKLKVVPHSAPNGKASKKRLMM
jgi:hypothetical protein